MVYLAISIVLSTFMANYKDMEKIIGRQKELDLLQRISKRPNSAFLAVYGRRRVGKTFLIRKFFQGNFDFYLAGLSKGSLSQQLMNFHQAMLKHSLNENIKPPEDWFAAFRQLETLIENSHKQKKVIYLDELPWMDTPRSNFISALEHFWNSWASARNDIILIVCGSAASWMINKLINNKGGLHNRVTDRMILSAFTLKETASYFSAKNAHFDGYQILQLYMVMGGIPFYLDQIDSSESATQNINRICFRKEGLLQTEFNNLYSSLFQNAENHEAIVQILAKKGMGMTRKEIVKELKIISGGSITRVLSELEESGFIRKYASFEKKERGSLYQLVDFYSLFYLKFLSEYNQVDEDNWLNGIDTPKYRAWSGYAFELICLTHIKEIKAALGISGVETNSSAWVGADEKSKAQIDLVIDRRDHAINLCEFKFSMQQFVIDKAYNEKLRAKMQTFRESSGTNKALFLTFISPYGLKQNKYSSSIVQQDVKMDIFFK